MMELPINRYISVQVDRILKPGGVIAIYMHSYWVEVVDHPKAPDLTAFLTAVCTGFYCWL